MKKMICLLLVLLLLCGCGNNKDNMQTPVLFYYPNTTVSYNSSDAVISAEIREGEGYTSDIVKLLNLYLSGPLSDAYKSPFPSGTTAVSAFLADSTLTVELSTEFADLKGLDLTIACACLTKTAIALTGCDSTRIYVGDEKLDGNTYINLDVNDLLLIDNIN